MRSGRAVLVAVVALVVSPSLGGASIETTPSSDPGTLELQPELISTSLVRAPASAPSGIGTGAVDEGSSGSDLGSCLEGEELMEPLQRDLRVDGSVQLVFDRPVTIVESNGFEPSFIWFHNLVDPDEPRFGAAGSISGGVRVHGAGRVLVVTPQESLPENEVFTLRLFVTDAGAQPPVAREFDEPLYRPVFPGFPVTDIQLDNYNGTTGNETGAERQVFIELPEVAAFEYKVFRIVDGEVVRDFNDPVEISNRRSRDDLLVHTANLGGQCTGSGAGLFYLVPLRDGLGSPVLLEDDTARSPKTVSLAFRAEDWEGNLIEDVLFDVPIR